MGLVAAVVCVKTSILTSFLYFSHTDILEVQARRVEKKWFFWHFPLLALLEHFSTFHRAAKHVKKCWPTLLSLSWRFWSLQDTFSGSSGSWAFGHCTLVFYCWPFWNVNKKKIIKHQGYSNYFLFPERFAVLCVCLITLTFVNLTLIISVFVHNGRRRTDKQL